MPIPKFASFRPCLSSSPFDEFVDTIEKHQACEDLAADIGFNQSRKFEHRRHPNDVRFFDTSNHHSNELGHSEKLQRTQFLQRPLNVEDKHGREPSGSFIIDSIGDPHNLIYGSLPRLLVPTYFRFGGGEVLGISMQNKIDLAINSNESIVSQRRHDNSLGKRSMSTSRKIKMHDLKTINKRGGRKYSQEIEVNADFISLKHPKKQEENGSDGYSSANDKNSDRSATRRFKPIERPMEQDLMNHSDTSTVETRRGRSSDTSDDELQQRMALAQKVEKDPGNCNAWLDLINFQDRIFGLGNAFTKSRVTAAERNSTIDIKIDMYEKALHAAKCLEDKERLLLGMMEEGSRIWDNTKLSSKWRTLLKEYPCCMNLWIRYLDFKQSDFLSFNYGEVRAVYLDCLRLLQNRLNTEVSMIEYAPMYVIQVYVTLRMTVFMREAGYPEHAIACWQAIVEYNFCKPIQYQSPEYHIGSSSESTALSAFEAFWESEVPRFGEEYAEGWAVFMSQIGKPAGPKSDAEALIGCGPNFESWAQLEHQRSLQSRNSACTVDDVDEDDPYYIALFSDIQPVLFDPPDSPGRLLLVQALLIFCHLPPCSMGLAIDHTRTWWQDSFLRNEMTLDLWTTKSDLLRPESVDNCRFPTISNPHVRCKTDFLQFPMPCFQLSSSSLFASKGSWFSAFDSWENKFNQNQGFMEPEFTRRLIKELVNLGVGGDDLAEYYIAFESRLSPTAAKKFAKNLIKHRPSSLRLYGSYAIVEYRLGNGKIANHVMATTINMSKSLCEEVQRDSIYLWGVWVWESLESGEIALALERLLMFSEKSITSSAPAKSSISLKPSFIEPAVLLRTQKALAATRDHFISLTLLDHAAKTIECLILFAYLSNELSLVEAHATFTSNLNFLSTRSFPSSLNHEYVHQAFAKLLHYHVTKTSRFKPSMIRSFLEGSVIQFPQNTIFLGLYAIIESYSRIDDRVRSIMRDVVLTRHSNRRTEDRESVISHFFAIYSEISRGLELGSNTSTIRSTFEHAVTSTCGAPCAGLWKLYFSFEYSRGNYQMAKSVFHRGVRACPWAKELYLLAFQCLGMVMNKEDLREIYTTMLEKELRILARSELENIFRKEKPTVKDNVINT